MRVISLVQVTSLAFLLFLPACSSVKGVLKIPDVPCPLPYPETQSEKLSYPILDENGGQGPVEMAETNKNDVKLKADDAMKANANRDFALKWCVLSSDAVGKIKSK